MTTVTADSRPSSTCWACSPTRSSPPSTGSPRTPGWRRPSTGRAALARMAAAEIAHHERLTDRLTELGADADRGDGAVRRRAGRLPRRHPAEHLAGGPGQGLRRRRAGRRLLPGGGGVPAAAGPGAGRWRCSPTPGTPTSPSARCAPRSPPTRKVAGRLALWARRLVGEALTQSQAVIAEHDELAELIIGGTGDLAGVGELLEADHHRAHRPHAGPRAEPLSDRRTCSSRPRRSRTAARRREPCAAEPLASGSGERPAAAPAETRVPRAPRSGLVVLDPTATTGRSPRCGERPVGVVRVCPAAGDEAHPALVGLGDLDVGDPVDGTTTRRPRSSTSVSRPSLVDPDMAADDLGRDLVRGLGAVDDQLPGGVLDTDLDFHVGDASSVRAD